MLALCLTIIATTVSSTSADMNNQLFEAAAQNDIEAVNKAINSGIDIDFRNQEGRTALMVATRANAIDAARLLIESGADVNATDSIKDSPFLYAGAEGRLEILKMTIEAGADLDSTNRYGGTALIPAAHHGHLETVRFLLTTEIDIDHVNNLGWTALLEAVILGDGGPVYQEIVRALLEAGADPSIGDNEGRTPLMHAENRKFKEIANLIRDGS